MIKQKLYRLTKRTKLFIVIIVTVSANFLMLPLANVFATATTYPTVLLTNMTAGAASSVIVGFKPANAGTTMSLIFQNSSAVAWTGSGGTGTVNTSQTVSGSYNGSTCAAILGGAYASATEPGTPSASGTAGTGTISLTTLTMVSGSYYCFVLTGSAITANPTTAAAQLVAMTAGTDAQVTIAIDIITGDVITITATVPATFTMSLASSDTFTGNLSTAAPVGTTGDTINVSTNAKNGWYLYISDLNGGLTSATQSTTIPSITPGTLTTITSTTANYDAQVFSTGATSGATPTGATAFTSATLGRGGGLGGSAVAPVLLASASGPTNAGTVVLKEYATITALTPAATDYSDTLTVIGAGTF
jgi:hypothetical protein